MQHVYHNLLKGSTKGLETLEMNRGLQCVAFLFKKKLLVAFSLVCFLISPAWAQTPDFLWAKQASASENSSTGRAVARDTFGNTYITGYFSGTATFGNTTLSANQYYSDVFIAKYNAASEMKPGETPVAKTHIAVKGSQPQAEGLPVNVEKPLHERTFPEAAPTVQYTYKTFPAEGNTFGYEILQDDKPIIRQTTIPGMRGNKGFATKADAKKVAEMVVGKLKKGQMPPSVTPEELAALNITF